MFLDDYILDKNISYSGYLAEELDNNIDYADYIAEALDDKLYVKEVRKKKLEMINSWKLLLRRINLKIILNILPD